jgi:hypothetical protein
MNKNKSKSKGKKSRSYTGGIIEKLIEEVIEMDIRKYETYN